MKHEEASRIAQLLIAYMQPACERIEVAGSIRRCSPEINDIELCAVPKWGQRLKARSLFSETESYNRLYEGLKDWEFIQWIKPGTPNIEEWAIKPGGKYWRGLVRQGLFLAPADIKLDLFLARPENWGVIYTIRTGSADFSRELVTYARDHTDYRVDGGDLKYRGDVVPCPDEETLFQALNLQWVTPDSRGGKQDLIILR